jgi:oligosaccharyltransferase complex subunit delta (ribophorin II)
MCRPRRAHPPHAQLALPQNLARPPSSLPPTESLNPLRVELLLGSFTHAPAKYELFMLQLPVSGPAPTHPDEPTFHPLPAIEHAFRPAQKVPPAFVSAVFVGVVLSPWFVLLGLVRAYCLRLCS